MSNHSARRLTAHYDCNIGELATDLLDCSVEGRVDVRSFRANAEKANPLHYSLASVKETTAAVRAGVLHNC